MKYLSFVVLLILTCFSVNAGDWEDLSGRVAPGCSVYAISSGVIISGGLYEGASLSTDSGRSWTQCFPGGDTATVDRIINADGIWWVSCLADGSEHRFFKSSDKCLSWSEVFFDDMKDAFIAFERVGNKLIVYGFRKMMICSAEGVVEKTYSYQSDFHHVNSFAGRIVVSSLSDSVLNVFDLKTDSATNITLSSWVSSVKSVGNKLVVTTLDGGVFLIDDTFHAERFRVNWPEDFTIIQLTGIGDTLVMEAKFGSTYKIMASVSGGQDWFVTADSCSICRLEVFGTRIFRFDKTNLKYSDDLGRNWILSSADVSYDDFKFRSLETDIFSFFSKVTGLNISSDSGKTCIAVSPGLNSMPYHFDIMDNHAVVVNKRGVYYSDIPKPNWRIADGLNSAITSDIVHSNGIFYAGTFSGVTKSDNFGKNWTPAGRGSLGKTVVTLSAYDSFLIAATDSGEIFKSTDRGDNWISVCKTPDTSYFTAICSLGNRITAGCQDGALWQSDDSGDSWKMVHPGTGEQCVFALYAYDTCMYASITSNDWLYVSTNSGEYWKKVGLSGVDKLYTYITFADIADKFFINTGEIYESDDFGQNWTLFAELEILSYSEYIKGYGSYLYVVYPTGIFSRIDVGYSGVKDQSAPDDFLIYPIPATDMLFIGSQGDISACEIYDILGKKVGLPIERGDESIRVRTSDLVPGTYFVVVTDRNGTTKKAKFMKQ